MNLRRFNKAKHKIAHMGWSNPWYRYQLEDEGIGSSPAEKDLGVLMDEKLHTSRQCALTAQEAKLYPGLHEKKRGQQVEGGGSAPLLCSHETPHGVLCPAPESAAQQRHGPVAVVPEEGHKDDEKAGAPLL